MKLPKMNMMVFMVVVFCGISMGEVYKVGDSAGWSSTGHFNYKSWTGSKTFLVGDSIAFEYKKHLDNVVRVTQKNFNACNAITTYVTFNSGNDTFVIRKPGHFYFISSFPDHCQNGQRVDIRVARPTNISPSPSSLEPITPSSTWAPSPSSCPPSEPITPLTRAPSPSSSPPPPEPITPSSKRAPSPSSSPHSEPISPSSTQPPSPSTKGFPLMLFCLKFRLVSVLGLIISTINFSRLFLFRF